MYIAIPQIEFISGDIEGNTKLIISAIKKASSKKADLVIFPELSVCGAVPKDLLERQDFIDSCRTAIDKIAMECNGIAAIVGAPNLDATTGIMYNSAYFMEKGEVADGVHKNILTDFEQIDESRYFVAGEDNNTIKYKGQNLRILFDEYEAEFIEKNDSIVIFIGTSIFRKSSMVDRRKAISSIAKRYNKTIITVNHCGAISGIVFDGCSSICNSKGIIIHIENAFKEDFTTIDTAKIDKLPMAELPKVNVLTNITDAIATAIHSHFHHSNKNGILLHLNDDIQSLYLANLCSKAIDSNLIHAITFFSDAGTSHPIAELCKKLHIDVDNINNTGTSPASESLSNGFKNCIINDVAQQKNLVYLTTASKTDIALSHNNTFYCGAELAPLGDLYTSDIEQLYNFISHNGIKKDAETIDTILRLFIDDNLSEKEICKQGFKADIVNQTVKTLKALEYLHTQAPTTVDISGKSFGTSRRITF